MKLTGYKLSKQWFDFCFENPEKTTPLHTALYFFAIEHCNRLGWKKKFSLPTEMAKEAIGVKSWHTYIKAFNDLVDWKFFELVERSKNQYSSNIIALLNFDEALDEALDEAIIKHESKQMSKHEQSLYQSNDSIYKLITDNIKLITDNYKKVEKFIIDLSETKNKDKSTINISFDIFWNAYDKKRGNIEKLKNKWEDLKDYERISILEYIPRYKEAQPDKKFRKDPATFLNNKSWNDELIPNFQNGQNKSNQGNYIQGSFSPGEYSKPSSF